MIVDIKKFPKLVGYFVFYDFYEFSTTIHNLGYPSFEWRPDGVGYMDDIEYTHFVLRWG